MGEDHQTRSKEPVKPGSSSFILGRIIPITLLAFVVGIFALIGFVALTQRSDSGFGAGFRVNERGSQVNVESRPADDFTLDLFDGGSIQLSALRGQIVVINFWASWCPPCRQEAAALEHAWQTLKAEGVVFIGIDIWDQRSDALSFIQDYNVTYPNGIDDTGAITVSYGVSGIPETFVIDTDGNIVTKFVGPVQAEQLIQAVYDVAMGSKR